MSRLHFTPSTNVLNDEKKDEFLVEEKIPVVMQQIQYKEKYKETYKPENKDLFSKAEMSKQEKKANQRKIKKIKKSKVQKQKLH